MHEWRTDDKNAVLKSMAEHKGFTGIIGLGLMPGLNGLKFTNVIEQDERTGYMPVILLTAEADMHSNVKELRKSADDYLATPFSLKELQARIDNLKEQHQRLSRKLKEEISKETTPLLEPKEPSRDQKFILKVRTVVEANISNSCYRVEMLAAEVNLSRRQLFRKMKVLINTSPSEFISDMRLQRAAQLIRAKADNMSQIGYAVGFNEQSYFAKRFRIKYGVSPTEYAEKFSCNGITLIGNKIHGQFDKSVAHCE